MTTPVLPRELSPSSIDRYRSCPRRFLWQDVERLPFDQEPTQQQVIGIAVHKALEVFFRHEPGRRSQELLSELLVPACARASAARPFDSSVERQATVEKARALADRFVDAFDIVETPIRLEQSFELRLRNGTRIRTRIDRIDPWGSSGVRVIDYKTGESQVDSRDMARETASIVHLLAAEHAGFQVERLSLLYLRSGEEVYWEPEREDVEFAAEQLRRVLSELRDDRDFGPSPSGACLGCPFRDRCDASASAATARLASAVRQS